MSQLSQKADSYVKWDRIVASTAGLLGTRGKVEETQAAPVDADRIKKVFETAKTEFAEAGKSMRKLMNLFLGLVGVSVIVAIVGLVIVAALKEIVAGSVVSTAGILGMLALFGRVHRYGRDQALFQFLISKYELVISLSTPDQYPALLDAFLKEVALLRDPPPAPAGG